MAEFDERIDRLQSRLENLVNDQERFAREISKIRYEINVLRAVQQKRNAPLPPQEFAEKPPVRDYVPPPKIPPAASPEQTVRQSDFQPDQKTKQPSYKQVESPNFGYSQNSRPSSGYRTQPKEKSDLEKFIGENLISKIGIVILVLGVAIGAKYAIDNNLISPLTRIIIGYAFGFGLIGLAVRLKEKYHNFSAVLLSGGMAIMYFITYAAYSYYDLMSQPATFVLMLIFTIFTVFAAIIYERVVIAHIGLVGAYTIPFLLSDNSGRAAFLFTYMAIINAGILAISVRQYWKSLCYSALIVTWMIFTGWFFDRYAAAEHFNLALGFSTVFFFIFYFTFLSYKAFFREEISNETILLVLANSFIYYGLGYSIVASLDGGEQFLGIFTVANAGFHFVVAFLLSRYELVDKSVLYLPSALILVFLTIAVPVQSEGNWITLAWTAQAFILFWLGRTRRIPLFEYFSYPLMALASISLLNDWQENIGKYSSNDLAQYPVFNVDFLTTILFVAAFGFIYFLNKDEKHEPLIHKDLYEITKFAVPTVLLIALYNAFRTEIGNYFHYQLVNSAVKDVYKNTTLFDKSLELFNIIWQINYTMLFFSLLSLANIKKLKSTALGFVNTGLNTVVLLVFLAVGLFVLGELRESYLAKTAVEAFQPGAFHIFIRYISYAFAAGLMFAVYKYFRQEFILDYVSEEVANYAFDFLFYFSLWIVVSSELINWMDIFGYESYKLGLSILWGVFSLGLIVLGISRNTKHLRIGAIALFALTLVKLFFYDIAGLDTISKTVVFVSLGILLLIISFLYNKYKNVIFEMNNV